MILPVYLTVDTEISCPLGPRWRERALDAEIARDVLGHTAAGEFGIVYQMRELDRYGLRASFFVETLFSETVGEQPLRDIVSCFDGRHDLQLHTHVEWLARMVPPRKGPSEQNLSLYSDREQYRWIGRGIQHLRQCGAPVPNAFRAGNYAADLGTLRVLGLHGIRFDTSQNICYPASFPDRPGLPVAPWRCARVFEFPVSFFRDWPGHYRPAQLCACSSSEMEHALHAAHRQGWPAFVIVWHSFELTKRLQGKPDRMILSRFHRLCRFLAEHADKFQTRVFSDTVSPEVRLPTGPLASNALRTLSRLAQQVAGRCL